MYILDHSCLPCMESFSSAVITSLLPPKSPARSSPSSIRLIKEPPVSDSS